MHAGCEAWAVGRCLERRRRPLLPLWRDVILATVLLVQHQVLCPLEHGMQRLGHRLAHQTTRTKSANNNRRHLAHGIWAEDIDGGG